jgi:hypothetical protein
MGTGLGGTGTLACVGFAALTPGAQPRVAVPPDFFSNFLSLRRLSFPDANRQIGVPGQSNKLFNRHHPLFEFVFALPLPQAR